MSFMDTSKPDPARSADTREDDAGRHLEAAILDLLAARDPASTICPSDAARAVAPDNWRPLMDPARSAAARLVASGDVEITQGGDVVDLATARGPIRIRRKH